MEREVVLSSRRKTARLGYSIGKVLREGDLVLLRGALGAGKTVLAEGIARGLGVPGAVPIPSPTFAILYEYPTTSGGELLHGDLYRLREGGADLSSEIARLGLRERRAEGAVVLLEWADGASAALGDPPELSVTLEIEGKTARRGRLSGPRAAEVSVDE